MTESWVMAFVGITAFATVALVIATAILGVFTYKLAKVAEEQIKASAQDAEKMGKAVRLHAAIMHQVGFYVFRILSTEKEKTGRGLDLGFDMYGAHNQPDWAKEAVKDATESGGSPVAGE